MISRRADMKTAPTFDEISGRMLEAFPKTVKIILFGSRASPTYSPDSDFDLLVVSPTDLPPTTRATKLRLALKGLEAGFDIIVVTPQELEQLRNWRSSVVGVALREGKVLHEAA
jgi:predicted nucleotidyltransferase